jgi:signal transduction histidine kinase
VWGEVIGIVGASVKREGQEIDLDAIERFASQLAHAVRKSQTEEAVKKYAEELEQSNHLKSLFMDVMHHDIMNPAGVIKNAVDIVEMDEELKDPSKMALIKRNTRKIIEIVESATTYSRLESNEDIKKDVLDLNELIINVIGDLRTYAKEKNQNMKFTPGGEQKIRAGTVINSIFSNIISNAIKYSGDGTEITIKVKDEGDNKIISVKDQGEGIADGHKESIFNRFKRREKGGVKGSGLGLAITKRIVEMHDGRVWVEDNPDGKGSVFFVSLPKN